MIRGLNFDYVMGVMVDTRILQVNRQLIIFSTGKTRILHAHQKKFKTVH